MIASAIEDFYKLVKSYLKHNYCGPAYKIILR